MNAKEVFSIVVIAFALLFVKVGYYHTFTSPDNTDISWLPMMCGVIGIFWGSFWLGKENEVV